MEASSKNKIEFRAHGIDDPFQKPRDGISGAIRTESDWRQDLTGQVQPHGNISHWNFINNSIRSRQKLRKDAGNFYERGVIELTSDQVFVFSN